MLPVHDVALVASQQIKNRKNIIFKLVYAFGLLIAILFVIFIIAGALSKFFFHIFIKNYIYFNII